MFFLFLSTLIFSSSIKCTNEIFLTNMTLQQKKNFSSLVDGSMFYDILQDFDDGIWIIGNFTPAETNTDLVFMNITSMQPLNHLVSNAEIDGNYRYMDNFKFNGEYYITMSDASTNDVYYGVVNLASNTIEHWYNLTSALNHHTYHMRSFYHNNYFYYVYKSIPDGTAKSTLYKVDMFNNSIVASYQINMTGWWFEATFHDDMMYLVGETTNKPNHTGVWHTIIESLNVSGATLSDGKHNTIFPSDVMYFTDIHHHNGKLYVTGDDKHNTYHDGGTIYEAYPNNLTLTGKKYTSKCHLEKTSILTFYNDLMFVTSNTQTHIDEEMNGIRILYMSLDELEPIGEYIIPHYDTRGYHRVPYGGVYDNHLFFFSRDLDTLFQFELPYYRSKQAQHAKKQKPISFYLKDSHGNPICKNER